MKAILVVRRRHRQAEILRTGRLPPLTDPLYRLNVICPYFTMFPLSFPVRILRRASPRDWVLEPFCGRGTTLFAARLLGLASVGLDSNPVAAAVAGAKLVRVTADEVTNVAKRLLATRDDGVEIPTGDFWTECYHFETLAEICKLRSRLLENCTTQAEVALRAVLLGILHGPVNKGLPTYLSNQMPRTYATKPKSAVNFWRKRGLKPKRVDVLDAVRRRASFTFASIPAAVPGKVFQADSRTFTLPARQRVFRWVITSPPYYGMRSYWPDQWLRNWFLGGPAEVSYTTEQQIPHSSKEDFVASLSEVWRRSAAVCVPGARLVVRFGALPSVSKDDPKVLLARSLRKADCGWRITTVMRAGTAQKRRRLAMNLTETTTRLVAQTKLNCKLDEIWQSNGKRLRRKRLSNFSVAMRDGGLC
jgi:hypothetical protein